MGVNNENGMRMCVCACVLGHVRVSKRENERQRVMWLRTLGGCGRDETEFFTVVMFYQLRHYRVFVVCKTPC